ncbi:sugar transferase [Larkinella rosea]|uniref:Sugar transferase n=1 Tax=Larkinella rosea TaxID=2025312 RepID=A0A3P1BG36_9BACT|nr:sugar transferase [Larkinella rosea]RRB00087.1 sugar transferase [Larkinella rosea]
MISLESRVYPLPSHARPSRKEAQTVYTLAGKRFFDLLVTSLVTTLVLVWLAPLIALAIVLTSQGPVFVVQLRTGRNGRPFRHLKFRTTAPLFQNGFAKHEPEVTAIGRFLRSTHLDEIPNFFNVLAGDMSIVGPRPHTLQYDAQHWTLPGYRDRHTVRPGITGLVQTRIYQKEISGLIQMPHSFRYDRWYVRRCSLLLDFKICWWAISGRFKAAG